MSDSKLLKEFRDVVESVFNSWTALQLAVSNAPGGRQNQEKVTNMINYITQLICEHGDIDSYDVADSLHEMMDENFQTICEDNSPEEIGDALCAYFLRCKAGEKHLVDAELGNIKKISSDSQRISTKSDDLEMPIETENDASQSESNVPAAASDAVPMEMDSEWTTVRSKRRN